MVLFNPALAGSERAIGGAMEHDVEDGIHRAMGKSFGARNEVTGGIVDQDVKRPIGESGIHQALDSFGRADIDDMSSNLAGERLFELPGGILEDLRPAAADHQLGTELDHAPAHRLAEPGAPTGDQDAFSLEKIQLKHVRSFAFSSRRAY
jgi:hypothetical protein